VRRAVTRIPVGLVIAARAGAGASGPLLGGRAGCQGVSGRLGGPCGCSAVLLQFPRGQSPSLGDPSMGVQPPEPGYEGTRKATV
jgi:hypothetical protein